MDSIHGYAFYFAYFVTHIFDLFLVFVYVFSMENAAPSSSASAQPAETATQSGTGETAGCPQTCDVETPQWTGAQPWAPGP